MRHENAYFMLDVNVLYFVTALEIGNCLLCDKWIFGGWVWRFVGFDFGDEISFLLVL